MSTTSTRTKSTYIHSNYSSDQPTFIREQAELSDKVLDAFTAKIAQLEHSFDELAKPDRKSTLKQ